ncbi:hypothetical protein ACHRVK_02080 [Flavobacterium plurextorum]|uniref:hypothetical protein n=1 Tax=Flavobacterium plurextorum TaxID=1114867 RepID=UPI003756B2FB
MKAKVFIERGTDGSYGAYVSSDNIPFGIVGDGKTVEEAKEDFLNSYQEMKEYYKEENKSFIECEFEFSYGIASKEDFANTKTQMIKCFFGLFFTLVLIIIGLYFK